MNNKKEKAGPNIILKMTGISSHTTKTNKDMFMTRYLSTVLYWGFLIWGFSEPNLGIFYGSTDFQGFLIWGFSYTINKNLVLIHKAILKVPLCQAKCN